MGISGFCRSLRPSVPLCLCASVVGVEFFKCDCPVTTIDPAQFIQDSVRAELVEAL